MGDAVSLPPCPHCGCKRSEIIQIRESFGRSSEYRQCSNGNCRRHFSVEPTVAYDSNPIRCVCANCYGKNPAVVRTVQKADQAGRIEITVRYHKCAACGYTFKSIESHRAGP